MKINIFDISFEYNGVMQSIYPVLLQNEEYMVLVDAGYPSQIELFEDAAKQKDIRLEKLTHIIITHHDSIGITVKS